MLIQNMGLTGHLGFESQYMHHSGVLLQPHHRGTTILRFRVGPRIREGSVTDTGW